MDFSTRRPSGRHHCMDRCNGGHPEHLQTVMSAEGMHLCPVHRRDYHRVHQPDGYGNQARRLCRALARHHHPVLFPKRKSTHRFCRLLGTVHFKSERRPVDAPLHAVHPPLARPAHRTCPRLLFPGLFQPVGAHYHRALYHGRGIDPPRTERHVIRHRSNV